MQTVSPPPRPQRLTAVLVAVVLMACTPGGQPPPSQPTPNGVLESRSVLGPPMVALAESVIALADQLAAARYEVTRGPSMQQAVDGLADAIAGVQDDAAAASQAADVAEVMAAAAIVRGAALQGRGAAAAAEREVTYLSAASRVDTRLLDVVALWDEAGSQSEIRSRLHAAAADAARLRRAARGLKPVPADCRALKRNRVSSASTVHARTLRLQSQANSGGGGQFDDLRATYRRLPFGVEPRSADQLERRCWRQSSAAWGAAQELRLAVEALEAALQ